MISKEEVLKLAELARLQLSGAEVEGLQKDISNILDYVGQVSSVEMSDTKSVPLLHNILREDTTRAPEDMLTGKEESLRAAFPKREGNFNSVRKIIEK